MDPIEFGSVCSGIEAASVAWHPLGWRAAWLAEIEPFPAAALAHHHPTVPNLGDMTTIARRVLIGEVSAPDVLAGGTPCQGFSVAGLRKSLEDERGNLTLKFVELANAIDFSRTRAGKPAASIFWENVPGVLTTADNAFGCFLAGLAGENGPLEPPEPRPAAGKSSKFWKWDKKAGQHNASWGLAGCVFGPQRAIAWRTMDAQYFGVAQRRRRVFVVASARPGFDPASVLFEWDGMRRDSAPSRETGEETAGTLASRTGAGGFPGTDEACSGYLQPVTATLDASYGRLQGASGQDSNHGHSMLVVHGSQDPDTLRDMAHTLGINQGQENAVCVAHVDIMPTLRSGGGSKASHGAMSGDSKDEYLVPVIPHVVGAICRDSFTGGAGGRPEGAAAGHFIAYTTKLHNTASNNAGKIFEERSPCLDACSPAPALLTASQVRRLTPVECERLQGFPDGYTAIPWRGKPADQCPDGPRYKALGNSWAVPVARWIGRRINTQILKLEAQHG
ncbi:DNA cytosine methyltransferase [Comamonas sp. JUb58]|uniref:DNA cytosine methyltransferase n=1 Tax=Comamonas sp. JUb58 TaxID=2485114 RepID=UPI00105F588F|nr:DNA cytosine methyltransferase [Comamonas sp. JUb58]TDS82582.1 DNA (cytosine-5)-methyltransferase 1 [Comamonas sp. JUb58]